MAKKKNEEVNGGEKLEEALYIDKLFRRICQRQEGKLDVYGNALSLIYRA